MNGLFIPESQLHKPDLQQRINFAIMFGWDKLPEITNPDPHDSDNLLSHYSKLEKIKGNDMTSGL